MHKGRVDKLLDDCLCDQIDQQYSGEDGAQRAQHSRKLLLLVVGQRHWVGVQVKSLDTLLRLGTRPVGVSHSFQISAFVYNFKLIRIKSG